jgi:hypothetical protein
LDFYSCYGSGYYYFSKTVEEKEQKMIWFIVAIGYVALAGYILYQAYMLDQYRRWVEELKPPF